jgi:flagellar protein FliS
MATLDFKIGGQLAQDLENLYIFMIDKLIEANVHNKVECLDEVEKLLNTLYTAWKDVIENPRPDGVPSPTLQPEEFKKYQEQLAATDEDGRENKRSGEKEQSRGNLKVVA